MRAQLQRGASTEVNITELPYCLNNISNNPNNNPDDHIHGSQVQSDEDLAHQKICKIWDHFDAGKKLDSSSIALTTAVTDSPQKRRCEVNKPYVS